jgi:hypothetical protein
MTSIDKLRMRAPSRGYSPRPPRGRCGSCGRRPSQQGVSLVESLIATALLAFVAVSIFPLFHQSVTANISGSDSNQAIHHGSSELESLLALPFDSVVFEMEEAKRLPEHEIEADGAGHKMTLSSLFFDPGAKADSPSGPTDKVHHIATGEWIADEDDASGFVLWQRSAVVRQYSYADISSVIDASSPGELISAGHRYLFDSPLRQDALDSQINFVEEDVTIESQRPGSPDLRARLTKSY